MRRFMHFFLALVITGASLFSQNPIQRLRLEHPGYSTAHPLPSPPYAIFYGYINSGLNYFYSLGPSVGTPNFSLMADGLIPSSSTVNIAIPASYELYNPNTSTWTGTSFTLAFTGGTITQGGYSIRLKSALMPGAYNETFTLTSAATSFTLAVSGFVSTTTDFVMVVKTNNAGSSANNQFEIPVNPSSYTYNYVVDWGDGSTVAYSGNSNQVHTYSATGTYTIKINGFFPHILFNNTGDKLKLLSINQWGSVQWRSMSNSFFGCSNMVGNYSDAPDLSLCTSLTYMLGNCVLFNSTVSTFSVGSITNLEGMFYGCSAFNQPLNTWDVSNVINIDWLFALCTSFNQPLNSWDVSSVITFNRTFYGASLFNQNINSWDVSSGSVFIGTFQASSAFNQPLNSWNMASAGNTAFMFNGASMFNQDISGWNMSGVSNTRDMFAGAAAFNYSIGAWDMSSVFDITEMFYGATAFNQDISSWDVSSVTNANDFMYGKSYSDYSSAYLDAIYNTWSTLTLQPNVLINFGTIKYTSSGVAGRLVLTSAPNNWTIVDGGL